MSSTKSQVLKGGWVGGWVERREGGGWVGGWVGGTYVFSSRQACGVDFPHPR